MTNDDSDYIDPNYAKLLGTSNSCWTCKLCKSQSESSECSRNWIVVKPVGKIFLIEANVLKEFASWFFCCFWNNVTIILFNHKRHCYAILMPYFALCLGKGQSSCIHSSTTVLLNIYLTFTVQWNGSFSYWNIYLLCIRLYSLISLFVILFSFEWGLILLRHPLDFSILPSDNCTSTVVVCNTTFINTTS